MTGSSTLVAPAGLVLAAALVVFDLGCNKRCRGALRARLELAWQRLRNRSYRDIIHRPTALGNRILGHLLGEGGVAPRCVLRALLTTALLAAASLAAGAWLPHQSWGGALHLATDYFLVPGLLIGALALLLTRGTLGLASRRSFAVASALLLALVCTLVVLWLAAMHAGTWFEWQQRRSAVAWGSEWFYAELYHEYLGWGRGAAISVTMAVILLLPPAPFIIAAVAGSLLRILAPALAPLSVTFTRLFERVPRGIIAIAIALAVTSIAATETPNSGGRGDVRVAVPRQIPGPANAGPGFSPGQS
jgi:hypothetical protein